MTTLRNRKKLAAVARGAQEEHPVNGLSCNRSVPKIHEDYITQVTEEVEGRVNNKKCQEINRTESSIWCALNEVDQFFWNSHVQAQSGIVPGTSRSTGIENQELNEHRSQNSPSPEAEFSVHRSPSQLFQTQTRTSTLPMSSGTFFGNVLEKNAEFTENDFYGAMVCILPTSSHTVSAYLPVGAACFCCEKKMIMDVCSVYFQQFWIFCGHAKNCSRDTPESYFFENTLPFFRYSGVYSTNIANFPAKRL